jgi:ribonuclease J
VTTPGNELLFLALGGSDEIGMNVNLYGCQGKWLMVDLGLTFAGTDYPGVDLVLPDLSFIEERRKDLLGVVLTHGHEDHIGAIPYLSADLGVPLYATEFTARLILGKLEEEGIADKVKVHIIPDRGTMQIGPFHCSYIPLAHSIPDMSAVLIDTPYGRIFHTGDWKLDDDPVIGEGASPAELQAIGDAGVLALVCDSTNVFNSSASGSEGGVKTDLLRCVSAARGRVVVTSFASNAARLQTLGDVARETGRKLCVAGRSLDRILAVGKACGMFKNFPEVINFDTAMNLPRRDVLVVATGGQGEDRAALARIAADNHPIKLEQGDSVIFSSRQIPGNEKSIGVVQNNLARKNVIMITEKQAHVHVSGHPGRPELAALYGWLRPEILVPVHGERRHMAEQSRFGVEQGIKRTIVQSNGDVIRLAPKGPTHIGYETTGRLVLDGDVILPADGTTITERRRLALYGTIQVAVAIDADGCLHGRPAIKPMGVPVEEDKQDFIDDAMAQAETAIAKYDGRDEDKLREAIRLAVRRCAAAWTGKKPIVDVSIIRI